MTQADKEPTFAGVAITELATVERYLQGGGCLVVGWKGQDEWLAYFGSDVDSNRELADLFIAALKAKAAELQRREGDLWQHTVSAVKDPLIQQLTEQGWKSALAAKPMTYAEYMALLPTSEDVMSSLRIPAHILDSRPKTRHKIERPDYRDNGKYQFVRGYTGGFGAEECIHLTPEQISERCTTRVGPGKLIDNGVDLWWEVPVTDPDLIDYRRHYLAIVPQSLTKCPKCDSPDPARHPAVQFEGEVQVCSHPFHSQEPQQ